MLHLSLLTVLASALAVVAPASAQGPYPGQIKNLVTFGDSYSDVNTPGDNATAWPVYAAMYGNFTLYPFAKSGATCSNYLTYRPYPPVFEYQLPLYFTEKFNGSLEPDPTSTMYMLWIGTNDVGANALLTGSQTPGVTLVDTISCAVDWVRVLYTSGARNFIFQNSKQMLPLQDTILYSANSYPNRYWTEDRNTTEWNVFMTELTNTGNALSRLMLQALAPTLEGAHLGIFDSYGLISDIRAFPQNYLNGTAPLNVTGCINSCIYQLNESTSDTADCTVAEGTARDSFLWYDELHPSEQTDRVIARELAAAIVRNSSSWITWLT
ncbi:carbohydrate esterase family 16 protein [Laetiporus sulphureus 93-53]|uniref:Carbohydrate esterase family 16 protein n=1 Tax=Laetiporus sulphureus 93-53 TaxID=1314785 RepID=A0A165B4G8_9APHY|nr:carbohydrate esterase family 16 protein [Laetiporus sulphureus 93-53]KZT00213.1 carbohydrate esterase family 16 protein [Laetiporus sulphureus 93-53]